MPAETLNEFKVDSLNNLLRNLMRFKMGITTSEDFRNLLEDLHTSFTAAINSLKIISNEPKKIVPEDGGFRMGRIIFYTSQNKVVGLNPEYSCLESSFVNKDIDTAVKTAELYSDFDERACDICGCYVDRTSHSLPTGRERMVDYIHAFHPQCKL